MSDGTRPVSSASETSALARAGAFLFFTVFLVAGAAFGIAIFGKPFQNMLSARDWQSVSCEIISSHVQTKYDSDGSTYRVEVTYRYFVDDRSYVGNRYKFMAWSTSGLRGKRAIVARLAPGTRTECWVNPADPADSVIERGLTADVWFGLIPLLFILVGGGGIYVTTFGSRFKRLTSAKSTTTGPAFAKAVRGGTSATLRPRYSRGAKLAGFVVIALFWNGILSVFLFDLLSSLRGGNFRWFVALFLIPFVLVGILLVALAIRQALQLSNPRPSLTVNNSIVALGDELRVDWSMEGRVEKLTRFSITLEAREQATYTRGTDRVTDTNVFATIPVANHVSPQIVGTGSAKVRIPAGTMHSFDATSNKVLWVVRVRGEVPNWPDSDDEFPITVAPRDR